ncbi:MAG: hypothetical protein H7843_16270 [Nitrospirota bacterium]
MKQNGKRTLINIALTFGEIATGQYLSGGCAMAMKEHIVKYTDNELCKLVEREGMLSDWDKAASMTQAEIEACVAYDSDEAEMVMDWDNVTVELPRTICNIESMDTLF